LAKRQNCLDIQCSDSHGLFKSPLNESEIGIGIGIDRGIHSDEKYRESNQGFKVQVQNHAIRIALEVKDGSEELKVESNNSLLKCSTWRLILLNGVEDWC